MNQHSLGERIIEAIKRDGEKLAVERRCAMIARGAIDAKDRVLLKASSPMRGEQTERSQSRNKVKPRYL
jgi:hypothetical protein